MKSVLKIGLNLDEDTSYLSNNLVTVKKLYYWNSNVSCVIGSLTIFAKTLSFSCHCSIIIQKRHHYVVNNYV